MTTAVHALSKPTFKHFKLPQLIIARFTALRTARMATIWGLAFGISTLSSITGFVTLYKTPAAKAQLIVGFGHNTGLNALFGVPYHLDTAGGFTAWRMLGVAMLICGIWGLLTSTRVFRGEEENGRWEMFLSGQTTSARAALNALAGLLAALSPLFLIPSLLVYIAGQSDNLNYSLTSAMYYGLAVCASAALFMSVGALMSQLAPIRRRAAMYGALIFGICFLVRAAGDADSNLQWLTKLSPLGWVEKMRPLTGSDPFWLLPIIVFCLVCGLLTVYLASQRDLGGSLLADKDTAKARKRLLKSPFRLTVRLEKNPILGWTIGAGFVGFLYGSLAKSATDVLKGVNGAGKAIDKIAGGHAKVQLVEAFLGAVFLLLMILIMVEATNLVGAIRNEESDGHLDNLLVRPVGRLSWLAGRLITVMFALLVSCGLGTALAYLAVKGQHLNVSFHEMLIAGINILPAILFVMGVGVLAFGYRPRLTTTAMYTVLAWSFLMEMIGSAVNLNHYILDVSVLHHVALAPAVHPHWMANLILLGAAIIMCTLGAIRFDSRDLQGE